MNGREANTTDRRRFLQSGALAGGAILSGRLSDDEKVDLDNRVTKALGGIMVAVENYPDLKANQNFLQLQGAMNEIEEQISAARRAYNAAVTDYNNAVEMFPTNILASMMNYKLKKDVLGNYIASQKLSSPLFCHNTYGKIFQTPSIYDT